MPDLDERMNAVYGVAVLRPECHVRLASSPFVPMPVSVWQAILTDVRLMTLIGAFLGQLWQCVYG